MSIKEKNKKIDKPREPWTLQLLFNANKLEDPRKKGKMLSS